MFNDKQMIRILEAKVLDLDKKVDRLADENFGIKREFTLFKYSFTKQLFKATVKPKYKVGEKIGAYTVQEVIIANEMDADKTDIKSYYYTYTLLSKDLVNFISRDEKQIEAIK